jgi:hypothetical protein
MKRIGIVGGGASGIVAAIAAARTNPAARVFIIEQKEKIGKKILATGNGRCNLTNEAMDAEAFRGDNTDIVTQVLAQFGYAETIRFFESLGLMMKHRGTYIYPRSDQAQTVLNLLIQELERLQVEIYLDMKVMDVSRNAKGFKIKTNAKTFQADKLILACGGKASSALGSDGSGYTLVKNMGHKLSPIVPALVQLKVKKYPYSKASGVRTDAKVSAVVDGKVLAEDTGELQMTAYGISGIPVFQISRFIAKGLYYKQNVAVIVDFLPDLSAEELKCWLETQRKRQESITAGELLAGIFNQKLIPRFLERAGIRMGQEAAHVPEEKWQKLIRICKGEEFLIEDTNGYEHAQVCAGGVKTSELDPCTMESRYIEGLYIVGELLDIDGICGGYNLQWAWATGYLAGTDAAK